MDSALKYGFLIFFVSFIPFFSFSQISDFSQTSDTVKTFDAIKIKGEHNLIEKYSTLNNQEIEQISPTDLGTLLQYVNGITIKNYGGIGAMKTLSYRGMGGQHTQLVIDNSSVNNPLSEQINFANIPINTVKNVKILGQNNQKLLPVTALVKGSTILLETTSQSFSLAPFSLKTTINGGSFGLGGGNISLKRGGVNNFISLSGNYQQYNGNYPYQLPYANKEVKSRRNNSMKSYNGAIGTGFRWKTKNTAQLIKIYGKLYNFDQELPGAVVLYNDLAAATMHTQNIHSGIHYQLFSKKIDLLSYVDYANNYLHYHDPNYLNIQGYLDNLYINNSILGGFHLRYKWKKFSFHLEDELSYDQLENNRNLGVPSRVKNTAMTQIHYNQAYFSITGSLFYQYFFDQNNLAMHQKTYQKWQPQIAIYSSDKLLQHFQFYLWYKPSSRAPSFNELYYSQVGNKDLKPEEASQIDFGGQYLKKWKTFLVNIKANIFHNTIRNKILALPTKNLFIWSIQNIGKVNILGTDLQINGKLRLGKNWQLSLQLGINYQNAIDVSDKKAVNYKNQIAYIPQISGNTVFRISYKRFGLNFNGLYVGGRYSLNENIPANYLEAYFIMDLSADYSLKLNQKNTIVFDAGIKNLANTNYNFIRYFVMPGRNYFIKISYAFN